MKLTKLIGFVAVSVVVPSTIITTNNSALAGDIQIRTPNVEAVTRSDGSVYVNSGDTTVRVPSRRRYWTPWRYWRLPWQSNIRDKHSYKCRHSSHQSTSRITSSGSQIIQNNIASNTCN
ncbi:MAG: hypothetical protein ACFCAD_15385 [Pleurocapsa sp.]